MMKMRRERTDIIILLFVICGAYVSALVLKSMVSLSCAVALVASIVLLKRSRVIMDKIFAFSASLPAGAILIVWMWTSFKGD